MAGPFAEGSIVLETDTDVGLHRDEVIDRYSLPESETSVVRTVEAPAGEPL